MSDWNLLSGDAVRQVRQLVAEQLANGRPAPEKLHLRRRPTFEGLSPPVATYTLDNYIDGWSLSGATYWLTPTSATGWYGSNYVAGDESIVGISHDKAEADPSTNGNYEIATTGLYRISVCGPIRIKFQRDDGGVFTNAKTYNTSVVSGHYHTVAVDDVLGFFGGDVGASNPLPCLYHKLHRKPDGDPNALFQEAVNSNLRAYYKQTFPRTFVNEAIYNISYEWYVPLNAGDRISIVAEWYCDKFDYGGGYDIWWDATHGGAGERLRMTVQRIEDTAREMVAIP